MPDEFTQAPSASAPQGNTISNNSDIGATTGASANLDDLKKKIGDDLDGATEAVKEGANTAMQKVQDTVSEQTDFAARQVGGIAIALQKVGAELASGDQPQVGRYAKQIGDSIQAIAKKMEGRGLGEIAGMTEDFGRRQPLAFLGVAALAGLAASRFLTASATRSRSTATVGKPLNSADSGSVQSGGFAAQSGGSNNG